MKKNTVYWWLYNIFDPDRFKDIIEEKGIDLTIDFMDEKKISEFIDLIAARLECLDAGEMIMNMTMDDDIKSFSYLMMVASLTRRGRSWYTYKESKLFEKRILGSVRSVARFLNEEIFGENVVSPVRSSEKRWYPDPRVEGKVKVKWERFPGLLSNRDATVYSGWIYTTEESVIKDVGKNLFKARLNRELTSLSILLKKEGLDEVLSGYVPMIEGMLDIPDIPGNASVIDIVNNSPACIRSIDRDISYGVDIGYTGYLIQSFYLKTFKDREDLVYYFYSRNPENLEAYPSVDAFLNNRRDVDYIFKQMYGETGGGINYSSYSCKTIHDEGYCPFSSVDSAVNFVMEFDSDVFSSMTDGEVDKIIDLVKSKASFTFKACCGMEFYIKHRTKMLKESISRRSNVKNKYVGHPVRAYFDDVLREGILNEGSPDGHARFTPDSSDREGEDNQQDQ